MEEGKFPRLSPYFKQALFMPKGEKMVCSRRGIAECEKGDW
ncbi:hypothetical protein [Desulfofundulus thermobenzoicus]|nr:hypothetical protein [Desulfofundulus thermobenzoicus]